MKKRQALFDVVLGNMEMDLSTCCGLFQKGYGNQGSDRDRLPLDSSDHGTGDGALSGDILFYPILSYYPIR